MKGKKRSPEFRTAYNKGHNPVIFLVIFVLSPHFAMLAPSSNTLL